MMRRRVAWLAWGLWSAPVLLVALIWVLDVKNQTVPALPSAGAHLGWFAVGALLIFCSPGALIISRQPHNPIGWLLFAIGLTFGVGSFCDEYGFYALVTEPASLPAGVFAAWVGSFLPTAIFGLAPLLFLLFPNGKPLSRRWRPLVWVTIGVGLVPLVQSALYPGSVGGDPRMPDNPTGIHGAEAALNNLGLSLFMLLIATLASLVALRIRFRQSQGVERQQLKWFSYGALILALALIGFIPLLWSGILWPILVGFGAFTACIAIAVLRYRLYDIDRIISRTLAYGLLTVLLGGSYAGVVLGLSQLLGRDSPLVVAGATLAVAAAFQPARRRIQAVVDRRFNRRRYDAARTIAAFSARLRQQVDLDTLTGELLAVVEQTMQPASVSVWLRPSVSASPGQRGTGASRAAPQAAASPIVRTGL